MIPIRNTFFLAQIRWGAGGLRLEVIVCAISAGSESVEESRRVLEFFGWPKEAGQNWKDGRMDGWIFWGNSWKRQRIVRAKKLET